MCVLDVHWINIPDPWYIEYAGWIIVAVILLFAAVFVPPIFMEKWKEKRKELRTVVFVLCYDNLREERTLTYGSTLAVPIPERDGFSFAGWYWDTACTIPLKPEQKIKKDCTLYAKWNKY